MSVETGKPEPPQPILIQAGSTTEPEADQAEAQNPVVMAVEGSESNGGLEEAIAHYEWTLQAKPSVIGMSLLGIFLVVGLPLMIVLSAFDSGDDDALGFACFSVISGITLLLAASSKDNAWRKKFKLANERIVREAGLEAPPGSKTPHVVAGVFAVLSVLAPSLQFSYSDVMAGVSFMVALLAAAVALNQEAEGQKVLKRNVKAIVEHRGNEQE